MLIIGRLYWAYEAAVVPALSRNELQWDAATIFSLITKLFYAAISGGLPGENHCHCPRRIPTPSWGNMINKVDFWTRKRWWLTCCNTLSPNTCWGVPKWCYWTEDGDAIVTFVREGRFSWFNTMLACVNVVFVVLLFLCLCPSRWWRAAMGPPQARVYFTTLKQG